MWKIKVSSVLLLVVNGEIHKDPNKARRDFFFLNVKSRNGSNMIFFRIHMDPPPFTTEVLSHKQLALISWAY